MDRTTTGFIEQDIELLQQASDLHGVIPQWTIGKIEQIIGELEYLIED